MSTKQITRTEQADTITYTMVIDGTDASTLVIDTATRKVWNIETAERFTRQGLATELWAAANAEAECYHASEHHRTPEGDAFANAVGGATIDPDLDIIDECSICCGDDFSDHDDDQSDDWPW